MEKQPTMKQQQQQSQLSPQEWETLIDDFSSGDPLRFSRWLSLSILDLSINSLLRRETPLSLKPQILLFLEESLHLLPLPSPIAAVDPLIDALRSLVLSPSDASPLSLKEQAMVSVTSVAISAVDSPLDSSTVSLLSSLVELLLAVVNRPNHGPDRQTRAAACECLRELETAFPLLLADTAGHLWALAQSERTHAAQSYVLLLASVVHNVVHCGLLSSPASILSTSTPLVPFTPQSCLLFHPDAEVNLNPSELNLREIRRVMAFLLERPQAMNPVATLEMVSILTSVAGALEGRVAAVSALLKVQFSGLIYSFDPVLCHVVLVLHSCLRSSDAFASDDDLSIARRLALIPKESNQPLVFRLLALHWLLGSSRLADSKTSLYPLVPNFYPTVFDPLALKAKKLDVLAIVAACVDALNREGVKGEESGGHSVVKLFEDGLVCVSAYKWLPPWSSETSVAFRTLHKFLIGVAPHHGNSSGDSAIGALLDSTILSTMQNMLVKLALEHRGLIQVIAIFLDRLLGCEVHLHLGERLLQTFDEHLLPKLEPDYRLASYFPLFERIAKNDTIPPRQLLELLTSYIFSLAKNHGPDTGLRSWSQGSKVLGICRMMLMHHHSSRIFHPLSNLLSFTCQFYPDLEVRDHARIYLRMLVCIPGKKLRHIMSIGEQLPGISPSPHPASFLQVPSPRPSRDLKKSLGVSSYIYLERVVPLLVKQSWSLTLPNLDSGNDEAVSNFAGIRDISTPPSTESEREDEVNINRISSPREPLRVMDSKIAKILEILRRHFACIPDYRHMPGIKIKIPCTLRFESEPFNRVWGADVSASVSEGVNELPALYATVISFSSTSKYGSIPPCRVPFLLGDPPKTGSEIVTVENNFVGGSSFRASLMIELETREPMPGLIDVTIKANAQNGQVISGSLQSISVGIEDMFYKAIIPSDIKKAEIATYYSNLFHALWEACGNSANTGRETFPLSGGKGVAAICGTGSVKLLEVVPNSLISAVEQYLAPFVVGVIGDSLVNVVKSNGVIRDVAWGSDTGDLSTFNVDALVPYRENLPLQLPYVEDVSDEVNLPDISKRNMGILQVLIFLPPRFHLLFQMEVGHTSTLVRIRTDHWPSLAYVDDYLESLSLL